MALPTVVTGVTLFDGTGTDECIADVEIREGFIGRIVRQPREDVDDGYPSDEWNRVKGQGLALCPGFIDTHTHDDIKLIEEPEILCKLSQGVTTVIVGNCGASAALVNPNSQRSPPPPPINLLGERSKFNYRTVEEYRLATERSRPSVNVATLVGHTSLRNLHMDQSLNRKATDDELQCMQSELRTALAAGAIGLSSGLAYQAAKHASITEMIALANILTEFPNSIYATHMRTEADEILDAMEEAFLIGRSANVPLVISHLKCAGKSNWGRTPEVLDLLTRTALRQPVTFDCYPYAASSTILDLDQVTDAYPIKITSSESHPEMSGRDLSEVAAIWGQSLIETAAKLRPATAVYHNINEEDMRRVLTQPGGMIGSDGLPFDPRPHPRLWGTFPRVLGRYSRDLGLLPMKEAIRKMTSAPAGTFHLDKRGLVKEGYWADLVLFDPRSIIDRATYDDPVRMTAGIEKIWVNGLLSFEKDRCVGRSGMFISRRNH